MHVPPAPPLPPPKKKKKSEKYFSGNFHVKFEHFINFSRIYFRAKMSSPQKKFTELLRLCLARCSEIYDGCELKDQGAKRDPSLNEGSLGLSPLPTGDLQLLYANCFAFLACFCKVK